MPYQQEDCNNHTESLLTVPEHADNHLNNCNGTADAIHDDPSSEAGNARIQKEPDPPLPPEGGYGWVVLTASFLINGLVEGTCTSFGVFLPVLLEYFQVKRGKMALAGALLAGCFTIAGPFAGGLVNRFGCRPVAMVGALMSTAGLILSTLTTSIDVFIVLYGAVSGIGLGLMYLPATVMVSFYFERKRAIATGISYSGAGIGMVVMAPLSAVLLAEYDWKNAIWFIACITLNGVVLGALLRPWELPAITIERDCLEDISPVIESDLPICEDSPDVTHCRHWSPRDRVNSLHSIRSFPTRSLLRASHKKDSSSENITPDTTIERNDPENKITPKNSDENLQTMSNLYQSVLKNCLYINGKTKSCQPYSVSCHELNSNSRSHSVHHNVKSQKYGDIHLKHLHLNPLARKDIFYSGSIRNISQHSLGSHVTSSSSTPDSRELNENLSVSGHNTIKQFIRRVFHLSVVTNPYFLVIVGGSFLIQLGYFVPVMYITEYAVSNGIDIGTAATLLSIMGMCNSLGRASLGALANVSWINVLHVHNICLMIAGVVTIISMFVEASYLSLSIYAAIWGYFIAAFVPLATIFLVDYLGLEQLTNSFGILSLVRGLSSMSGPPIAGVLIDSTGCLASAFYFAGTMFILSGFLHYLLPLVRRCSKSDATL